MDYLIKAGKLVLEHEVLENASVGVSNGRIAAINPQDFDGTVLDLSKWTLCPAFIDIHVHGGNGHDTMDAHPDALNELSLHKLREGVGYFCPTTMSTPLARIKSALAEIATLAKNGTKGAKILGAFVEGPYIDKDYRGAHSIDYIRPVDLSELEDIIEACRGFVLSFGISPGLPNAMEAIALLKQKNINVRIGHSGADCKTTQSAIRNGANIAIHTYNAMSGLNHRNPGMLGAVLTEDDIYCELICDFIHVAREAVDILYRIKGSDKLILITDAMSAAGLKDGDYTLGEQRVSVTNGIARTLEGRLAGSTITIPQALKHIKTALKLPFDVAVRMCTATPAKALGLYNDIGSIAVSKKASFTAIDKDFNIGFVMLEGEILIDKVTDKQ